MSANDIGDYKVLEGPFVGGFGEVYKVIDRIWCDDFALKTLSCSFLLSSEKLIQFRCEIDLWINLPTHPNIVRAIEAFEFEGRTFLVMEWVSGGSLKEKMSSFDAVQALSVCRQIAEGMGHIHSHGLIHGDLKPGNVLIWGNLCPQISDFGLASLASERKNVIGGTHGYMAPEQQWQGATVLSDIYAAGVIFNEIIIHLQDDDFGIAATRTLAAQMANDDPTFRPQSFLEVRDHLNCILRDPPYWPTFIVPGSDRRTFKEKTTAEALPEKYLMSRVHSEIAANHRTDVKHTIMEVLKFKSDHAEAMTILADLTAEDGNKELAIKYLRAARSASAGNHILLFNICVSFVQLGEYIEAREIIESLGDAQELAHRIWHLRGDIANKEGDVSEAIICYRQAIKSGGDNSAKLALARALGDAGLLDEAIETLESIDIFDSQVLIPAKLNLARYLINKHQYDKGVNTLRRCLRESLDRDTSAYIYSEIGYVYMKQGLFDAAAAMFRKLLEIDSASEVASRNLDYCQKHLQRQDIGSANLGRNKELHTDGDSASLRPLR